MIYDDINCYPLFETNQILSSVHLNRMFSFLDNENRKSRKIIAGTGIICGLEVKFNKTNHSIQITKGKGITKEAFALISNTNLTFSKYREYKPGKDNIYKSFYPNNSAANILELLRQNTDATDAKKLKDLSFTHFKNKVAVIFLDYKDEELKTCTGTSCDNKGKRRLFDIKFLIVEKSFLSKIDLEALVFNETKLPKVKLPRFNTIFHPKSMDIITEPAQITKAFLKITNENKRKVAGAILEAYKNYEAFLGLYELDLQPLKDLKAKTFLAKESQYAYDFLNDLIYAYDEFREAAYKIYKQCCIEYSDYPRHLMLGRLVPEGAGSVDQYRNYFINSAFSCELSEGIFTAQLLFKKILLMAESFSVPASSTAKPTITPSLVGKGFSNSAIPYYYKNADKLSEIWNPLLAKQNKSKEQLSYHQAQYNKSPVLPIISKPLNYNINEFFFYRFEGHLNQSYKTVIKEYKRQADIQNLSCGIEALKLNKKESISDLLEHCRFDDLNSIYQKARSEYLISLRETEAYWEQTDTEIFEEEDYTLLEKYHDNRFAKLVSKAESILPYCLDKFDLKAFVKWRASVTKTLTYKYLLFSYIWKKTSQHKGNILSTIELERRRNIFNSVLNRLGGVLSSQHTKFFHSIYYRLQNRLVYMHKNHLRIFSNFNKKFDGLEHLAGGFDWGTLFLIYKDEKDPEVIADFFLPIKCCCECCVIPDCETEAKTPIPPFAHDYYITVNPDTETNIELNFGDDVNSNSKITITKFPAQTEGGKLKLTKNTFKYTSKKKFTGFDSFEYEITDSRLKQNNKDKGRVTIFVHKKFEEHIKAEDDFAAVIKGNKIAINSLKNDLVYKNTKIISTGNSELGASINIRDKSILYTSNKPGRDQFEYTIYDKDRKETSTATVTVVVFCCDQGTPGGCNAVDIPITLKPDETYTIDFSSELDNLTYLQKVGNFDASVFHVEQDISGQKVTITALQNPTADTNFKIPYYANNPDTGENCSGYILITLLNVPEVNICGFEDMEFTVRRGDESMFPIDKYSSDDYVIYEVIQKPEYVELISVDEKEIHFYIPANVTDTTSNNLVFKYSLRDVTDRSCTGTLTLKLLPAVEFVVTDEISGVAEDITNITINDKYQPILESDPTLYGYIENSNGFTNYLLTEYDDNRDNFVNGTLTNKILENFKSVTEPIIADIKKTNRAIKQDPNNEDLKTRNNINAEIYKNTSLALLNTVGGMDRDIRSNSNIYKYLNEDVTKNFSLLKKSSDMDLSTLESNYNYRFADRNNLNSITNNLIG